MELARLQNCMSCLPTHRYQMPTIGRSSWDDRDREACLEAHLNDLLLAEGLEGHVLPLILHKHDLPKGAGPQHSNLFQV